MLEVTKILKKHIEGAINIPLGDLKEAMALSKKEVIAVHCNKRVTGDAHKSY